MKNLILLTIETLNIWLLIIAITIILGIVFFYILNKIMTYIVYGFVNHKKALKKIKELDKTKVGFNYYNINILYNTNEMLISVHNKKIPFVKYCVFYKDFDGFVIKGTKLHKELNKLFDTALKNTREEIKNLSQHEYDFYDKQILKMEECDFNKFLNDLKNYEQLKR